MDYIKVNVSDGTTSIERTFVAVSNDNGYLDVNNGAKGRRTLGGYSVQYGKAVASHRYILRVKESDTDVREPGVMPGTLNDILQMYSMRNATWGVTAHDGTYRTMVPTSQLSIRPLTPAVVGSDAVFYAIISLTEVT